jgi:hypothetical protein
MREQHIHDDAIAAPSLIQVVALFLRDDTTTGAVLPIVAPG